MTLPLAILTYLVTWWISLFLVLPFRPKPARGLLINTLLAAAITYGIYLLTQSGLVPLRDVYH